MSIILKEFENKLNEFQFASDNYTILMAKIDAKTRQCLSIRSDLYAKYNNDVPEHEWVKYREFASTEKEYLEADELELKVNETKAALLAFFMQNLENKCLQKPSTVLSLI